MLGLSRDILAVLYVGGRLNIGWLSGVIMSVVDINRIMSVIDIILAVHWQILSRPSEMRMSIINIPKFPKLPDLNRLTKIAYPIQQVAISCDLKRRPVSFLTHAACCADE